MSAAPAGVSATAWARARTATQKPTRSRAGTGARQQCKQRAPAVQAARALPAGMEPVAWIDMAAWPPIRWPAGKVRADFRDIDGMALYTAAQVLAMGRVPVGVTDADLSAIYKQANGEDAGKARPLTTANIFRAMRALLAAAPRPPATPTTEPQAPTTGAGSATAEAAPAYRLLQPGVDTIQATDEVLADDVVTWKAVGRGIFAGMTYIGAMLPVRRALNTGP